MKMIKKMIEENMVQKEDRLVKTKVNSKIDMSLLDVIERRLENRENLRDGSSHKILALTISMSTHLWNSLSLLPLTSLVLTMPSN